MGGPSQYVRQKREQAAQRRLELVKLLRANPKLTNKVLAKTLGVTRDTIALDRKIIMESIVKNTINQTELMRAEMVQRLEALEAEVEKHRKDGKLSLSAVDRLLDITKALVELTGCRKPVNEKLAVTHRALPMFRTSVVGADGGERPSHVIEANEPLALGDGNGQ